MGDIITTEELKNPFSEYPKEMDEYFLNKEIVIKIFPEDLVEDVKDLNLKFKVKSAKQYYEYLSNENTFWVNNDAKGILNSITRASDIKSAITDYEASLKSYTENNSSQGEMFLSRSINRLQNGVLYSKSNLAKCLINYIDRETSFINGFKHGFLKNGKSSLGTSMLELEGLFTAFSFRGIGYRYDT